MKFLDIIPGDLVIDRAYERGYVCISSTKSRVMLLLCWGEGSKFSIVKSKARIAQKHRVQVWRDGRQVS